MEDQLPPEQLPQTSLAVAQITSSSSRAAAQSTQNFSSSDYRTEAQLSNVGPPSRFEVKAQKAREERLKIGNNSQQVSSSNSKNSANDTNNNNRNNENINQATRTNENTNQTSSSSSKKTEFSLSQIDKINNQENYQLSIQLNQWTIKSPDEAIISELEKVLKEKASATKTFSFLNFKDEVVHRTRVYCSIAGSQFKQILVLTFKNKAVYDVALSIDNIVMGTNKLPIKGPIRDTELPKRALVLVCQGLLPETYRPFINLLKDYVEFNPDNVTCSLYGNLSVIVDKVKSLPAANFQLSSVKGFMTVEVKWRLDGLTMAEMLKLKENPVRTDTVTSRADDNAWGSFQKYVDLNKEKVIRCYHCNRLGHHKSQCPDVVTVEGQVHRFCHNCGKTGHIASNCYQPKKCLCCNSPEHAMGDIRCSQSYIKKDNFTYLNLVKKFIKDPVSNMNKNKNRNVGNNNKGHVPKKSLPVTNATGESSTVTDVEERSSIVRNTPKKRKRARQSDKENNDPNFWKSTVQQPMKHLLGRFLDERVKEAKKFTEGNRTSFSSGLINIQDSSTSKPSNSKSPLSKRPKPPKSSSPKSSSSRKSDPNQNLSKSPDLNFTNSSKLSLTNNSADISKSAGTDPFLFGKKQLPPQIEYDDEEFEDLCRGIQIDQLEQLAAEEEARNRKGVNENNTGKSNGTPTDAMSESESVSTVLNKTIEELEDALDKNDEEDMDMNTDKDKEEGKVSLSGAGDANMDEENDQSKSDNQSEHVQDKTTNKNENEDKNEKTQPKDPPIPQNSNQSSISTIPNENGLQNPKSHSSTQNLKDTSKNIEQEHDNISQISQILPESLANSGLASKNDEIVDELAGEFGKHCSTEDDKHSVNGSRSSSRESVVKNGDGASDEKGVLEGDDQNSAGSKLKPDLNTENLSSSLPVPKPIAAVTELPVTPATPKTSLASSATKLSGMTSLFASTNDPDEISKPSVDPQIGTPSTPIRPRKAPTKYSNKAQLRDAKIRDVKEFHEKNSQFSSWLSDVMTGKPGMDMNPDSKFILDSAQATKDMLETQFNEIRSNADPLDLSGTVFHNTPPPMVNKHHSRLQKQLDRQQVKLANKQANSQFTSFTSPAVATFPPKVDAFNARHLLEKNTFDSISQESRNREVTTTNLALNNLLENMVQPVVASPVVQSPVGMRMTIDTNRIAPLLPSTFSQTGTKSALGSYIARSERHSRDFSDKLSENLSNASASLSKPFTPAVTRSQAKSKLSVNSVENSKTNLAQNYTSSQNPPHQK